MSRRLQVHAVGGYTVDLDIHNCCLTLVYQIVQKLSPDPALPEELGVVFDQVANNRAEFIASLGLQSAEGKEVINTVFNGGAAPKKLRDNETIKQLQRIALYVRWIACNLLHDDYMSLEDNKTKTFPAATIMSLMWHAIEDRILHVWSEHVLRGSPKHLSLHFDGLRVSRDAIQNMDEYIRACEDAISSKTPFNVKIVAKKHGNLIQLVQDEGTLVSKITTLPDLLKAQGKLHSMQRLARYSNDQGRCSGSFARRRTTRKCGSQEYKVPNISICGCHGKDRPSLPASGCRLITSGTSCCITKAVVLHIVSRSALT